LIFKSLAQNATLIPKDCTLFLIAAFIISGIVHTIWMRSRISLSFVIPLDGGLKLRQRRILGDNKTLRGLMVLIPGTGCSFFLLGTVVRSQAGVLDGVWPLSPAAFGLLGLLAGLGFMLGELPNSFIKRQMGILPGEAAKGPIRKVVFLIMDRVDSLLGMLLAISLVVPTPWQIWLYVFVLGPFIHLFFSFVLFLLKVKGRAA